MLTCSFREVDIPFAVVIILIKTSVFLIVCELKRFNNKLGEENRKRKERIKSQDEGYYLFVCSTLICV